MEHESADIFASPEAFEAYIERAAGQLRVEWEARVAFLSRGLERLQVLQRVAEAVEDGELARDLMEKSEAARQALGALQAAVPDGVLSAP